MKRPDDRDCVDWLPTLLRHVDQVFAWMFRRAETVGAQGWVFVVLVVLVLLLLFQGC